MSAQWPDVGGPVRLAMLTQSALPDKRPSQARNSAPVPTDRSWPVVLVGECPQLRILSQWQEFPSRKQTL